jgi:hypothetical protein
LNDWRFTASQFVFAPSPLRLTAIIFFSTEPLRSYSLCKSSLTRGWVSHLQLLLAVASAVILGSGSRGTHDHILLPQIRDPPPHLAGQVPEVYPPGTGWPSYTLRHWVPFSSPPTNCLLITSLHGPHRKHHSSIVALVSVAAETYLPNRCLEKV